MQMEGKPKKHGKKAFLAPSKAAENDNKSGHGILTKKTKNTMQSHSGTDAERIFKKKVAKKALDNAIEKRNRMNASTESKVETKALDDNDKDDLDSITSEDVDCWEDSGMKEAKVESKVDPPAVNSKPVPQKKKEKQSSTVAAKQQPPSKLKPIPDTTNKKEKKTKMPKDSSKPSSKTPEETDDEDETGTWVQCSNKECNKWRYVAGIEDPIQVPVKWECKMNTDKSHNSCSAPEVEYDETEHILTTYTIGSLVWAKLDGYPWWPGMIDYDPDYDTYFEIYTAKSMVPFQYHVTFFDDHVSRAWIRTNFITPYVKGHEPKNKVQKQENSYKKEVSKAVDNADKAAELSLQERVNTFGFAQRYRKKTKKNVQDSGWKPHKKKSKERKNSVFDDFGDPIELEDSEYKPVKTKSRKGVAKAVSGEESTISSEHKNEDKTKKKLASQEDDCSDADSDNERGCGSNVNNNLVSERNGPDSDAAANDSILKTSDEHEDSKNNDKVCVTSPKGKTSKKSCTEKDTFNDPEKKNVADVTENINTRDESDRNEKVKEKKKKKRKFENINIPDEGDKKNEKVKEKKKKKSKLSLMPGTTSNPVADVIKHFNLESKSKSYCKDAELGKAENEPLRPIDNKDVSPKDSPISKKCETIDSASKETMSGGDTKCKPAKSNKEGKKKRKKTNETSDVNGLHKEAETEVKKVKTKKNKKNNACEIETSLGTAGDSSVKEKDPSHDNFSKDPEKYKDDHNNGKTLKNRAEKADSVSLEECSESEKENINPMAISKSLPPKKKGDKESNAGKLTKRSASPNKKQNLEKNVDGVSEDKKIKLTTEVKATPIIVSNVSNESKKIKDKGKKQKSGDKVGKNKKKAFSAPMVLKQSPDREVPQKILHDNKSKNAKETERKPTNNDHHIVPCLGIDSDDVHYSDIDMEEVHSPLKKCSKLSKTSHESLQEYDNSEEEELDLEVNLNNIGIDLPRNVFCGTDDSDSDEEGKCQVESNNRKVIAEKLETNSDIVGRFAGRCADHNSDSDPLELIED